MLYIYGHTDISLLVLYELILEYQQSSVSGFRDFGADYYIEDCTSVDYAVHTRSLMQVNRSKLRPAYAACTIIRIRANFTVDACHGS